MSVANSESTVLGQSLRLQEGREKITGRARYTHDLKLPGMLHARLVPSLYAHANLRGIDASAALAREGVVAVLTAEDMPDIEPSSRYLLLLARDRVIFAGQPVALVLAEDEGAAEDGASLVQVDYEVLPAAMNIDKALAEGAPLVWPDGVPGLDAAAAEAHGAAVAEGEEEAAAPSNLAGETVMEKGDVAAGFAEAEHIVERVFNTPMVHQNSLETHAVICQPNPLTGGMQVWASTQAPFGIRQIVSSILGVPESDVTVTPVTIGGAFGAKFGLYEPLVAMAAHALGRPVRLALTRSEELAATNPAPPMRQRIRMGARADGSLCALEAEIMVESGCYPFGLGGLISLMVGSFYPVENSSVVAREVLSFKQSTGAYRAPGATAVIYALDTVMDELAAQLGEDTIEYRLRHCARAGQPMMNGAPWQSLGMAETLEALRDHPAWQGREAARAQGRGVGIAVGGWAGATEPAAAVCQLNRDGMLHIHAGAVDISGTNTGFRHIGGGGLWCFTRPSARAHRRHQLRALFRRQRRQQGDLQHRRGRPFGGAGSAATGAGDRGQPIRGSARRSGDRRWRGARQGRAGSIDHAQQDRRWGDALRRQIPTDSGQRARGRHGPFAGFQRAVG